MIDRAFQKHCDELNALCKGLQGTKEPVKDRDAFLALYIVKYMDLKTDGDVLLFCSALNLLNTYVKQKDKRSFGYFFKQYAIRLFKQLADHDIEGIHVSFQADKGMSVTYICINGLQFSFHCLPTSCAKAKRANVHLSFDGIKKQCCARTLFQRVFADSMNVSNSCRNGKGLKDEITILLEAFDNKAIDIALLKKAS